MPKQSGGQGCPKVREQLVGTSGANNKIWGYKVVQTVAAASERKGLGGEGARVAKRLGWTSVPKVGGDKGAQTVRGDKGAHTVRENKGAQTIRGTNVPRSSRGQARPSQGEPGCQIS